MKKLPAHPIRFASLAVVAFAVAAALLLPAFLAQADPPPGAGHESDGKTGESPPPKHGPSGPPPSPDFSPVDFSHESIISYADGHVNLENDYYGNLIPLPTPEPGGGEEPPGGAGDAGGEGADEDGGGGGVGSGGILVYSDDRDERIMGYADGHATDLDYPDGLPGPPGGAGDAGGDGAEDGPPPEPGGEEEPQGGAGDAGGEGAINTLFPQRVFDRWTGKPLGWRLVPLDSEFLGVIYVDGRLPPEVPGVFIPEGARTDGGEGADEGEGGEGSGGAGDAGGDGADEGGGEGTGGPPGGARTLADVLKEGPPEGVPDGAKYDSGDWVYTDGNGVRHRYNGRGMLMSQVVPGQGGASSTVIHYGPGSVSTQQETADGWNVTTHYEVRDGQLVPKSSMMTRSGETYRYTYDENGNITGIERVVDGQWRGQWDKEGNPTAGGGEPLTPNYYNRLPDGRGEPPDPFQNNPQLRDLISKEIERAKTSPGSTNLAPLSPEATIPTELIQMDLTGSSPPLGPVRVQTSGPTQNFTHKDAPAEEPAEPPEDLLISNLIPLPTPEPGGGEEPPGGAGDAGGDGADEDGGAPAVPAGGIPPYVLDERGGLRRTFTSPAGTGWVAQEPPGGAGDAGGEGADEEPPTPPTDEPASYNEFDQSYTYSETETVLIPPEIPPPAGGTTPTPGGGGGAGGGEGGAADAGGEGGGGAGDGGGGDGDIPPPDTSGELHITVDHAMPYFRKGALGVLDVSAREPHEESPPGGAGDAGGDGADEDGGEGGREGGDTGPMYRDSNRDLPADRFFGNGLNTLGPLLPPTAGEGVGGIDTGIPPIPPPNPGLDPLLDTGSTAASLLGGSSPASSPGGAPAAPGAGGGADLTALHNNFHGQQGADLAAFQANQANEFQKLFQVPHDDWHNGQPPEGDPLFPAAQHQLIHQPEDALKAKQKADLDNFDTDQQTDHADFHNQNGI